MTEQSLNQLTATAILGIDTLWGGDVMNPSGTGRFIADSWFADEPLPEVFLEALSSLTMIIAQAIQCIQAEEDQA